VSDVPEVALYWLFPYPQAVARRASVLLPALATLVGDPHASSALVRIPIEFSRVPIDTIGFEGPYIY
jgi:hypothetical protein